MQGTSTLAVVLVTAIGCVAAPGVERTSSVNHVTEGPRVPPPVRCGAVQGAGHSGSEAVANTDEFSVPIPVGYDDVTAEWGIDGVDLVLAGSPHQDYRPTITLRKVPVPGGSFADPVECARTGRGLMQGGPEDTPFEGTLRSAEIVDGPLGETCQVHLVATQGVALITELHDTANTPTNPKPVWLMVCNHADGDDVAETVCRCVLSGIGFRFRKERQ